VHHHIVNGELERILPDWSSPRQPIYAVIPSRRNVPAKVRTFIEFARSLVLS
jgi:DNA-binding transcriptional LysR family regulator